jgi:hypothetical protein
VKLHYVSPLAEHIMTIGCSPFQDIGGNWLLNQNQVGPGIAWLTGVGALQNVLKVLLNPDTAFTYAELFTKAVGAAPIFVATGATAVAGTSGAARISASQCNFGYRDTVGGHGRIVLVDQINPVNSKFRAVAYGNAATLAVVNYMISAASWIFSRQGGFPINVPQVLTKTNDILRKKYGIS